MELRRQGEVEVVNCGHLPPLKLSAGTVRSLSAGEASPPLGLDPSFDAHLYRLARGDRLLLYTDGLIEARSADGSFFPLERVALAALSRRSLEAAIEGLVAQVLSHAGGRLDDDMALLLVEVRG